jgi:cation transport ATPase
MSEESGPRSQESERERLERNLDQLLQELRVALPGVQVLFAFLLTVVFAQGFAKVTSFQEKLYFVTLLLTAISAALLITPSAYHRILFRQREKEHLVFTANRFAIAGLAFLALAMTGAVMLVTDYLFSPAATVITGILIGGMFVAFWYGLPLRRRMGTEPVD